MAEDEHPRRIVAAALRHPDPEKPLIVGVRHFDDIMQAQLNAFDSPSGRNGASLYGHGQGFVDNLGNFLTRHEACELALANGQLTGPFSRPPRQLHSEDLW